MIEYRFAPPDDPVMHEVGAEVARHYEEALRSAIPALVGQLETPRHKAEGDRTTSATTSAGRSPSQPSRPTVRQAQNAASRINPK